MCFLKHIFENLNISMVFSWFFLPRGPTLAQNCFKWFQDVPKASKMLPKCLQGWFSHPKVFQNHSKTVANWCQNDSNLWYWSEDPKHVFLGGCNEQRQQLHQLQQFQQLQQLQERGREAGFKKNVLRRYNEYLIKPSKWTLRVPKV